MIIAGILLFIVAFVLSIVATNLDWGSYAQVGCFLVGITGIILIEIPRKRANKKK